MKKIALMLLICISSISYWSCKKNGDVAPANSSNNRPLDIQELTVSGANKDTGTAPKPIGSLLKLNENPNSLNSISGTKLLIKPSTVGKIKFDGAYVIIEGQTGYYDIKLRGGDGYRTLPLDGGRSQDSTNTGLSDGFVIPIPAGLKPGQFCVIYYVYDNLGNISLPVRQYVTVSEFGPSTGGDKFVGEWKVIKTIDTYDSAGISRTDTFIYGQNTYNEYVSRYAYCDTNNVNFNYNSYYSLTRILKFGSNGGMNISGTDKYDYNTFYDCTLKKVVYRDTTEFVNFKGAWTYNQNTNIITIVYNLNSNEESAEEYKVLESSSTKLTLIYEDPFDRNSSGKIYFEK